ncbi:MAG TPA: uracil-DNA glycosylase family protein [Gemmatimonadaceae bacterium]|jgi:single-strand selective monofunctional uracil DNA glycosylase
MSTLSTIARDLRRDTARLEFGPPVAYVYRPLEYAWAPHAQYLDRYGVQKPREAILVGMNPGPFGMAQTGVPFGEIAMVRDWLGIEGPVRQPPRVHPSRPIAGFACTRSEVSGRRFWGWARDRFGTPERFFVRFFIWNYCPLVFMEESGRNRTPDKLPAAERLALFEACDRALARCIEALEPRVVAGLGRFAEARVRSVVGGNERVITGGVLHPSPANPRANASWVRDAERDLRALGVTVDGVRPSAVKSG